MEIQSLDFTDSVVLDIVLDGLTSSTITEIVNGCTDRALLYILPFYLGGAPPPEPQPPPTNAAIYRHCCYPNTDLLYFYFFTAGANMILRS